MRYLILLLCGMIIGITTYAQSAVGTPEQIAKFYKSKTYVVLDGRMMSAYDSNIRKNIEQFWDITEYEFITFKQFDKMRKDHRKAFLLKTEVQFTKDKSKARYDFLTLVLGNSSGRDVDMPTIANFPLSYVDGDQGKYINKLGVGIKFIKNHIKLTKENPKWSERKMMKNYNKNVEKINDKMLYVIKEDLEAKINTVEEIKEFYPHKIKIVSREEINEAIKNADADIVFLHVVAPEKKYKSTVRAWKLILSASDAKLYYFEHHKISKRKPAAFLKKDFKKLNRKNK